MTAIYVESIGLFAPGMVSWDQGKAVLAGGIAYNYEPLPKYKPQLLPPNERRRSSAIVRLAFGACEDAVGDKLEQAEQLATVFASSGGDYVINDQICRAVLEDEKAVSPTQFHNSVHNAAAGYWCIASKSQQTSISLSAGDYSAAGGFIEAKTLIAVENLPVLLACCDTTVVEPMQEKRPVTHSFASSLWLTPGETDNSIAKLEVNLGKADSDLQTVDNAAIKFLFDDNPSAKILPILELIAAKKSGVVSLAMANGQSIVVTVSPC